jgi:hypothetical protein
MVKFRSITGTIERRSGQEPLVRAAIRIIEFQPDPNTLPGDPAEFAFSVRLLVGRSDGIGEESFDFLVCSPEWLAIQSGRQGFIDGLHHVIVNMDQFDQRRLRQCVEGHVSSVEGATWPEVAARLARLGYWEFGDCV